MLPAGHLSQIVLFTSKDPAGQAEQESESGLEAMDPAGHWVQLLDPLDPVLEKVPAGHVKQLVLFTS